MQNTSGERADHITGSDRPSGDGGVGDEQVNAITDDGSGKPTGQDHSTEHHESMDPKDGVGAIQDSDLIRDDIARISDRD
jgi:hypothetical protein